MRTATRQITRSTSALPSHSRVWSMTWWEEQPGDPSAGGTVPMGELPVVRGEYRDDAGRPVQRTMRAELAYAPGGLQPGMWVQAQVGVRHIAPKLYYLPVMIVTSIDSNMGKQGGATLECEDAAAVLDGRPYEADTTLIGTLRTLVADCCAVALSRVTDVSGVPNIAIPEGMVGEFGAGRWSVCVRVADALGVQLRFTDAGDVIGRIRSDPPPASVANLQKVIVPPGGTAHQVRWPTDVVVLVTRGGDVEPLYGRANSSALVPPPSWYRPLVITQRLEGSAFTTQAQADQLAMDALKAQLGDLDAYEALTILPAPFLEAGMDTVDLRIDDTRPDNPNYYSYGYFWLRAMTMQLPSLETAVTLRHVVQ